MTVVNLSHQTPSNARKLIAATKAPGIYQVLKSPTHPFAIVVKCLDEDIKYIERVAIVRRPNQSSHSSTNPSSMSDPDTGVSSSVTTPSIIASNVTGSVGSSVPSVENTLSKPRSSYLITGKSIVVLVVSHMVACSRG